MDDTSSTPLLPDKGTGPPISSSPEAASQADRSPEIYAQEGEDRNGTQIGRNERKAQDTMMASSGSQGSSSNRREKPSDDDGTGPSDDSSQIAAAVGKAQDAVRTKRTFFPSAIFPFTLKKTPAEAAGAGGETPLDRDCAGLIKRLEDLGNSSSSSSIIADPMSRLSEATRSLALTDGADSKARRVAQFEVLLASAALTMVASREKVAEEIATAAKKIASEASALEAKAGGLEQQNGRSNDFLFCVTISGALALLPYLPTQIPEWLQPYIFGGFALVFYAASVGAILSFRATKRSQLKVADYLNTASFGGFSLLVIAFICSAFASENILLLVLCALLLLAGHLYAWSRS